MTKKMTKEEFADKMAKYLMDKDSISPCPKEVGLKNIKGCNMVECGYCWQQALKEAGLIKEGE